MLKIAIMILVLAFVEASQNSKARNLRQEVQGAIGLFIFLVSIIVYFIYYREKKQVVQFQQFQLTNPPTPFPNENEKASEKTEGILHSSLKQVSFQQGQSSPSQKKKRKRKAHRLSDRRRNNQTSQEGEEIEQNSDL